MFCHITQNWRGRPLVSRRAVVQLIGGTTTEAGLKIKAAVDINNYESGIKISKEEMQAVRLTPDAFHGEWNYKISR